MIDKINELQNKINMIKESEHNAKSPVWSVLDDKTRELSAQEAEAINAVPEVKTAKDEMMNAFLEFFLFGKMRDEFASIPAFRPACDKYITSVLEAKAARYKRTAELEEENARLKAEINKIKGAV